MKCDPERLEVANAVLQSFADSTIEVRRNGFYVTFKTHRGTTTKRWCCRGQDFYPMWHRHWPGGGTASTAMSQLIRWLRGQPVLPLSSWRYWASDTCKLVPTESVERLAAAEYPEVAACVLCGIDLTGGYDWWSLDGVTGPCCSWRDGCRQKREKATP